MKTIKVNDTEVNTNHSVRIDPDNHHVYVDIELEAEGKKITHVMTIGAIDAPLPANYDQAALQRDVDKAKGEQAAMLEGKLRAAKIAGSLQ